MTVSFPIVEHNLHGPDPVASRRHETMRIFLDHAKGGIGGFNEFNKADTAFFKAEAAKRGLNVSIQIQNGFVWDPLVVHLNALKNIPIAPGGPVGPDGIHGVGTDQKVGPTRFMVRCNLTVISTGFNFECDVVHLPHQAFTRMKWKLPLWIRSVSNMGKNVICGDGVAMGDMNKPSPIDIPGVADRTVTIPRSGPMKGYDQMREWGRCKISGARRFKSRSDHWGVVAVLFTPDDGHSSLPPTGAPARPVPVPKPKPVRYNPRLWRQLGAPVRHPFARLYALRRWKKRHPAKSRQIEAFKRRWRATH